MRRIIEGVTYNPETSTAIARAVWESGEGDRNVGTLYQTRAGAFFVDVITSGAGHTYVPKNRDEAKKWVLEREAETVVDAFDEPTETMGDGPPTEAGIYLRLPILLKTRAEAAAKSARMSLNAWITQCLERCAGPEQLYTPTTANPNYEECLKRVIEFVSKPAVAGFYIGMTGQDLTRRLHGYDHYYAGRRQAWVIAERLDEKDALDLEKYLCLAIQERKYRTTALFIKYDGKDNSYFPSAGGEKRVSPQEKVHQVYLAWRDASLPDGLSWRAAGNQAFLEAIKTRDNGDAKVTVAKNDAEFRGALANRDNFFLSMRLKLHFHTKDCRKGRPKNATNYTSMGTKATSRSFLALYRWAQQHRPAHLADEDQWHICTCCKKILAR
jgi:predicted HicB family RNase H-like nuclease